MGLEHRDGRAITLSDCAVAFITPAINSGWRGRFIVVPTGASTLLFRKTKRLFADSLKRFTSGSSSNGLE